MRSKTGAPLRGAALDAALAVAAGLAGVAGAPRAVLAPGLGSRTRATRAVAMAPGMTATQKTPRMGSFIARRRVASSGPATAPALSIAWWNPNARPARSPAASAMSASRGELRSPFPTRSVTRTARTCQGRVASATKGRTALASP